MMPGLYLLETAAWSGAQLDAMAAALPAGRRAAAARLSFPLARRESVAAAFLLLYALAAEPPESESPVFCEAGALLDGAGAVAALAARTGWPVGARGKPFEEGVHVNGRVRFGSLSHSEGLAAAAAAFAPVGADVQRVPALAPDRLLRIAARFHPAERAELEALPVSEISRAFCRLWACKESVLKLTGRGLSMPLSSFCVEGERTLLSDGRRVRLTVHGLPDAVLAAAQWHKIP